MKYIIQAFKDKGIKQKEVIRDLNVPQSYASALMNGKKEIGKEMAKKLADLYGFDEGALITSKSSSDYSDSSSAQKEIEMLKELIKAKDETIASLREVNDQLRSRLEGYESGSSKTA